MSTHQQVYTLNHKKNIISFDIGMSLAVSSATHWTAKCDVIVIPSAAMNI